MQDHTLKGIEFALPRGLIERAQGSEVASLLALADAASTEIDVLGEVLVVESRRQQPHDMHARDTAASGARHAYFGRDDWAPHAPGLKRIDDATRTCVGVFS
jgi:hypothetical protein